jgi:hypothetical protein
MFPIRNGLKQGDALSPMLFSFVLEYTIRRVYVNQDGLQLHGTHQLLVYAEDVNILDQLLVYAEDVNILGGSVHTTKENTVSLIVARQETGLEVNAGKTTYIVMSLDENARQSHNIKTDNKLFEIVEELKTWQQP